MKCNCRKRPSRCFLRLYALSEFNGVFYGGNRNLPNRCGSFDRTLGFHCLKQHVGRDAALIIYRLPEGPLGIHYDVLSLAYRPPPGGNPIFEIDISQTRLDYLLERELTSEKVDEFRFAVLCKYFKKDASPVRSETSGGKRALFADHFAGDFNSAPHFVSAQALLDERVRYTDFHQISEAKIGVTIFKIHLGVPQWFIGLVAYRVTAKPTRDFGCGNSNELGRFTGRVKTNAY